MCSYIKNYFMPAQKKKSKKDSSKNMFITAFAALFLGALAVITYLSMQNRDLTSMRNALSEPAETLQEGVSQEMFTFGEKTLVVHDTPPVTVTIYTSAACTDCEAEIAALSTKVNNAVPTAQTSVASITPEEARNLGVAFVPAVVFDQAVTATSFYKNGADFFSATEDGLSFQIDTGALGHTPKAFMYGPAGTEGFTTTETSATQTKELHAFLSTDCDQCKTMYDVLSLIATRNKNVNIIYHFADTREESEHTATAALACAAQNNKELTYRNQLFARQAAWKAVDDKNAAFTNYALGQGLDKAAFTQCLGSEVTQTMITAQNNLFTTFGVNAVPTLFIEGVSAPLVGVQTVAQIEAALQ